MKSPSFLEWMHRNFKGYLFPQYPCWNWIINGVLITYWMRTGLVKIYHERPFHTECFRPETEHCRESILALAGR